MKPRHHRQTNRGMSPVKVVFVISILAFLAVLLLPLLAQSKRKTHPFVCTNNIKQIALAYKIWAGDHNDKYPMEVSVTNGGTLELMNMPDAWRTFQVMSNELCDPRLVRCPQDSIHDKRAANFTDDLKGKISYLIAASATDTDPQLFLSGDDNFLVNQKPAPPGLINPASVSTLKWDGERHGYPMKQGWFNPDKKFGCGNIGLTDGSVQSCTDSGLTNYLAQAYQVTNRLIIP